MAEQPQIHRPQPRRAFELTPTSTEPSTPVTPSPETTNAELLDGKATPSRTKSLLNLTSSTLFGIYSPTGYDPSREEPSTPWGSGALTPSLRPSGEGSRPQSLAAAEAKTNTKALHHPHLSTAELVWTSFVRSVVLFAFGVAGGMIITRLHESTAVTPVKVGGINRRSWAYIAFWGTSGVILGNLLPWIDSKTRVQAASEPAGPTETRFGSGSEASSPTEENRKSGPADNNLGADWNPAVRGIGAFIGIAFAIRRLQWQSTMQASLTLALVNPCLWYMIDRTLTGFGLSTAVGIVGTIVLLTVNPAMVPPPTTSADRSMLAAELSQRLGGAHLITDERIGVATWIASVLFCSSVCFGNIGRRLATGGAYKRA